MGASARARHHRWRALVTRGAPRRAAGDDDRQRRPTARATPGQPVELPAPAPTPSPTAGTAQVARQPAAETDAELLAHRRTRRRRDGSSTTSSPTRRRSRAWRRPPIGPGREARRPRGPAVEQYVEHLEADAARGARRRAVSTPSDQGESFTYALNGFEADALDGDRGRRAASVVADGGQGRAERAAPTADRRRRRRSSACTAPRAVAAGSTVEDVVVGVIDTGIWPEHPSFADDGQLLPTSPGTTSVPCEFGDTADNPDDRPFTCNNKLIGARDMRDTYNERDRRAEVYDSARDYDGHGTHTASTAAGNAGVARPRCSASTAASSAASRRAPASIAYKGCGDLRLLLVRPRRRRRPGGRRRRRRHQLLDRRRRLADRPGRPRVPVRRRRRRVGRDVGRQRRPRRRHHRRPASSRGSPPSARAPRTARSATPSASATVSWPPARASPAAPTAPSPSSTPPTLGTELCDPAQPFSVEHHRQDRAVPARGGRPRRQGARRSSTRAAPG